MVHAFRLLTGTFALATSVFVAEASGAELKVLGAGAMRRMEFAYASGGLGKGGQVTLYVDGRKVGEDGGAPVSPDSGARSNAFTGTVKGV